MVAQDSDKPAMKPGARAGRPKGFDRDVALDAAMAVFWRKGFEAASIEDLLDATGLSRSSFYATFSSKHDLLLAAVRHYCDTNRDRLAEIVENADDPREAIHAMLTLIANGGGENGCLLVNCITELGAHDDDVRAIALDHGERIETLLETLILRERGGGASTATRAKARALISLGYGATLMRKSGMGEAAIREMLKTGEAMLD